MHWHNEIKPYLKIEELETPIQTFHWKIIDIISFFT
jgi:hypothetical protein